MCLAFRDMLGLTGVISAQHFAVFVLCCVTQLNPDKYKNNSISDLVGLLGLGPPTTFSSERAQHLYPKHMSM